MVQKNQNANASIQFQVVNLQNVETMKREGGYLCKAMCTCACVLITLVTTCPNTDLLNLLYFDVENDLQLSESGSESDD